MFKRFFLTDIVMMIVFSSFGKEDNLEYVDLDLPSGTLWAVYNVGAVSPEGYGYYFVWGETETKTTYTEENSIWSGVSFDSLIAKGVIDTLGNLTSKYDAATEFWGESWRMPTFEEIKELYFTDNEIAVVNGVIGRMFTGTNCNTLFLPFAGYRYGDEIGYEEETGEYWSASAMQDDWNSCYMDKDYDGVYLDNCSRDVGFSIRPVLRTK